MKTTTTIPVLEETKVNVKVKLAALWASLMFFVIYIDYFHLYMPGKLEDIQQGRVFIFSITQEFLSIALLLVGIPALMIFLSVVLPAKINRPANMIIAVVNIALMLYNLAGEAWAHMWLGAAIEVVLLGLVIYYAWMWPKEDRI